MRRVEGRFKVSCGEAVQLRLELADPYELDLKFLDQLRHLHG